MIYFSFIVTAMTVELARVMPANIINARACVCVCVCASYSFVRPTVFYIYALTSCNYTSVFACTHLHFGIIVFAFTHCYNGLYLRFTHLHVLHVCAHVRQRTLKTGRNHMVRCLLPRREQLIYRHFTPSWSPTANSSTRQRC